MKHLKKGGNPLTDRMESMDRFKTFIKPVLTKLEFVQIRGNSHIMVNHKEKTIIIPKASPSDTKHVGELQSICKDLKKHYEGYTQYLVFHRPKVEWIDKPIYLTTLQRIMKKNNYIKGIVCGLDSFVSSIKPMCNGEVIYNI
jgi:predicted RNA binding protein YcfA (HicA-like mRNA interferase family)